jgi:16S rRNA (cytosine967-C5)-methyltransferase
VFEEGAYADRALHAEADGLETRDRALATHLSYGAVQRRATLDHVIETLAGRPVSDLDPPVLAALRLGTFELLYSRGAAAHAAVNDAVELAKGRRSGGEGLVNAVLRRTSREGRALLAGVDDRTPEGAALLHSVPDWIARSWWEEFGPGEARALMASANEPAEAALRANTLMCSATELRGQLPVGARLDPGLPEALVLEGPFDAHGSELWERGAFMPQSRASMLVARALDPQPGERILDLCAAPGAKTTHIAALMEDRGSVVAVERHPGRAEALRRTCRRMGVTSVTVEVADAGQARVPDDRFDRVLVDPPCSGLGTLQARPDLRWRASPARVEALAEEQRGTLGAAAGALRPGGVLVYSTCTLSAAENEDQIGRFLEAHPDFEPVVPGPALGEWRHPDLPGALRSLPHRHRSDGFFIALLRRNKCAGAGAE